MERAVFARHVLQVKTAMISPLNFLVSLVKACLHELQMEMLGTPLGSLVQGCVHVLEKEMLGMPRVVRLRSTPTGNRGSIGRDEDGRYGYQGEQLPG